VLANENFTHNFIIAFGSEHIVNESAYFMLVVIEERAFRLSVPLFGVVHSVVSLRLTYIRWIYHCKPSKTLKICKVLETVGILRIVHTQMASSPLI